MRGALYSVSLLPKYLSFYIHFPRHAYGISNITEFSMKMVSLLWTDTSVYLFLL